MTMTHDNDNDGSIKNQRNQKTQILDHFDILAWAQARAIGKAPAERFQRASALNGVQWLCPSSLPLWRLFEGGGCLSPKRALIHSCPPHWCRVDTKHRKLEWDAFWSMLRRDWVPFPGLEFHLCGRQLFCQCAFHSATVFILDPCSWSEGGNACDHWCFHNLFLASTCKSISPTHRPPFLDSPSVFHHTLEHPLQCQRVDPQDNEVASPTAIWVSTKRGPTRHLHAIGCCEGQAPGRFRWYLDRWGWCWWCHHIDFSSATSTWCFDVFQWWHPPRFQVYTLLSGMPQKCLTCLGRCNFVGIRWASISRFPGIWNWVFLNH